MGKPFHYVLLFSFLFTAIIASIMFHDDNHVTSIAEDEKAYVIATYEQADMQMETILEKFHQFVIQPANEEETTCPELTDAVNAWMDTMELVANDPVFFVRFPEADEVGRNLIAKIEQRLGPATADFIAEVDRRREEDSHNQKLYDELRLALNREEKISDSAPCDRSECRWCRAKYQLTGFLLQQMGLPNKPHEPASN